jgi:hypothetical protein
LSSPTCKGWFFLFIDASYLDGLAFLFLTSATWKAGFSLHCLQLLGEVVFSLIDVSRVADPDPGSDVYLTLESGSGMGKKSGSGSKMNNPDHIS